MNLRAVLDYQKMMADEVRMRAYQAAIAARCPGKVVCEIGVGLGPLSMMALNAGARRVYGIEANPEVLEAATRALNAAGFGPDRFVPLCGRSYDVRLPSKVNVLLSETLDSTGLGENTLSAMADAARRFLKADGTLIPSHLGCAAALATPEQYRAREDFWRVDLRRDYGLDYAAMADAMRGIDHHLAVDPSELFSSWVLWQEVDLGRTASLASPAKLLLPVQRAGTITGLATAFVAVLTPDQMLSTFPDQAPTHWQQGFLPFERPLQAEEGDLVYVELTLPQSRSLAVSIQKRVAHVAAAGAEAFRAQLRSAPTTP